MKKKPAKQQPHKCFNQVNEQLKPFNTQLEEKFQMDFGSGRAKVLYVIATHRIDPTKRKPAKAVVASFCPFCGIKLD